MCGIAGVFHYSEPECPVDREALVRMTRALAHRGPDGEGFFVKDNVGLGHRRLSIVDLSPSGAQPMGSDDGSCWISYNGEFYNHAAFRERLIARGHRFRGTSDTETMLRLMESEGPESLAGAAGIFGFAFWDGRDRSLTLARDPMGVKQVYFHDDGRRIVFASEIKALLQDPTVPRAPDPEAINQYLHFHTALFERTFFRDIRVLRPGEYLRITRYGAQARRYWRIDDFSKPAKKDAAMVEELKHELTRIVGDQLMADVPVGSFFSGGIDSSAVAAHAAKSGKKPVCFGVHFSGQGVTDERPYQEQAAKALGLDLQLITMDGSTFPEDLRRLMYHQDEPVIGAAMFPMWKVSELAASQVKVCLGGQAADELFGGYARYALGRPLHVMRSWFAGRNGAAGGESGEKPAAGSVGGNLSRQFAEGGTLVRLARNARHLAHWETSYFEHFAKVPEESWRRVLGAPELCSRAQCRQIFHETVAKSAAKDPLDKIMHWDAQTYLPGLFHQDDRMSMAASLESRVPFADPRLARFAFTIDPDLKLRGGASKWALRQAVADVLPAEVLNRRKVGFDTPALRWMTGAHAGFVRETLLSARARQRGFWNAAAIEGLLGQAGGGQWFDVVWKVLAVEVWAGVFLDGGLAPGGSPAAGQKPWPHMAEDVPTASTAPTALEKASYLVQECREMGVRGTLARGMWEAKTRSGLLRVKPGSEIEAPADLRIPRLPFADPKRVAAAMRELLPKAERERLARLASDATRGRILCFSKWMADYGNPIEWHRDPTNGHRWRSDAHWSKVLHGAGHADVKFTWEAARFPQAYFFARAAAFDGAAAPDLAGAFASQVGGFLESNPPGKGVQWYSGQEVAFRIFAWLFGFHVFSGLGLAPEELRQAMGKSLFDAGAHIAEHIEYARESIYNNHLLSEALGLYVAGSIASGEPARAWREEGLRDLTQQADRQFYPDGAYIQQSHNYHRVALQIYLWATQFARANGENPPAAWTKALERSLDFLVAHQNEEDGRLPNYGSNDGAHPMLLACGDLGDFRPALQAVSVATRGERIYEPGPWDEMAVWHFGEKALELPLRKPARKSVAFEFTGYQAVRGKETGTFGTFRCGTIPDRFSQIDMLHLDVWWRGQNVLVDAGSYRYNGAHRWHNHFLRTGCHNTVTVDGRDQMLHFRQFKTLYWTEAKLLRFEDAPEWAICEGEHYGYQRGAKCTHRRAVLLLKDDLWVVADSVTGAGTHEARLHWLAGPFPWAFDGASARLRLETPRGAFGVRVLDGSGSPCRDADVAAGREAPARGWHSRYYGEKEAVPSFEARQAGAVPLTFVSLLGPEEAEAEVSGEEWTVSAGGRALRFRLRDGRFEAVRVGA